MKIGEAGDGKSLSRASGGASANHEALVFSASDADYYVASPCLSLLALSLSDLLQDGMR